MDLSLKEIFNHKEIFPLLLMGFFGNGFLLLLSFYNKDFSLALETIKLEGILISSIIISSALLLVLEITIAIYAVIITEISSHKIKIDRDVIFALAILCGLGIAFFKLDFLIIDLKAIGILIIIGCIILPILYQYKSN